MTCLNLGNSKEVIDLRSKGNTVCCELSSLIICNWCKKFGNSTYNYKHDDKLKVFCSEVCFSNWRRTYFKLSSFCDSCLQPLLLSKKDQWMTLLEKKQSFQFCCQLCCQNFIDLIRIKKAASNKKNRLSLPSSMTDQTQSHSKLSEARKAAQPYHAPVSRRVSEPVMSELEQESLMINSQNRLNELISAQMWLSYLISLNVHQQQQQFYHHFSSSSSPLTPKSPGVFENLYSPTLPFQSVPVSKPIDNIFRPYLDIENH